MNTSAIRIAQKNRESSISELRAEVIEIVSDLKNTYWRLVYALGDLEVKRLSLQLAYDLVKINEAQVNVGTLAPIEVLQARPQQRREKLRLSMRKKPCAMWKIA